jgi:hypothetical protein
MRQFDETISTCTVTVFERIATPAEVRDFLGLEGCDGIGV